MADLEEKDQSLNQSISDKAVCRTAPATPGLLNRTHIFTRPGTQGSIDIPSLFLSLSLIIYSKSACFVISYFLSP